METARTAQIHRVTGETDITLTLSLDGSGRSRIETGIGFLDHMLTALARHALFDLDVEADGDLQVDDHHTTEDIGIALGQALAQAIGDKAGIRRYGHAVVPMDEALVEAAVDISGPVVPGLERGVPARQDRHHGYRAVRGVLPRLRGQCRPRRCTSRRRPEPTTTISPKAASRRSRGALRAATEADPRTAGVIPSTKGVL